MPIAFLVYEEDLGRNLHAHGAIWIEDGATAADDVTAAACLALAESLNVQSSASGFAPVQVIAHHDESKLSAYLTKQWPLLAPEERVLEFLPDFPSSQMMQAFDFAERLWTSDARENSKRNAELQAVKLMLSNRSPAAESDGSA